MATLLSACDSAGKFSGLSNDELATKIERCSSLSSPSPSKAIACGNYSQECQRRTKAGDYYEACS